MKRPKIDDLKVFGFGLAVFIPLFVYLKTLHHHVGPLTFILGIGGLLFILSKVNRMIFPYILILVGIWLAIIYGDHRPLGVVAFVFLGLSIPILLITFFKPQALEGFYNIWMKGAHFIGMAITGTVLIIFYYLVFGLAGIVLRLIGKDLLDRKLDPQAKSYWLTKKDVFDKDSYKRQF